MHIPILPASPQSHPSYTQTDEALRLLADYYSRCFQGGGPHANPVWQARWHAYELVRNALFQAQSQSDALSQLDDLAQHVEEEHAQQEAEATAWQRVVLDARALVAQVIETGGSPQTLIVGETDGFRHLCLHCCQDEQNFQHVRFFDHRDRRPLLIPEVKKERRSAYDRCQVCLQALAPVKYVVLIPAGTARHGKGCRCQMCNQAGFASVVHLYESDRETHTFRLPALAHIAAPSLQQARKCAAEACWQHGWYLLFEQPHTPTR
jgi:hypothetical protein